MKKIVSYIVVLAIGLGLGLYFRRQALPDFEKSIQIEKNKKKEKSTLWTCSMHPEIRQHQPGKCPICGMDLIPMNHSNSERNQEQNNHIKLSKNALALANVQTTKAVRFSDEFSENEIKLSGRIEEDATSLFIQTAHIGGRLEHFSITYEGEYVKKGQYIGAIYSPEIVTAEQELLIASENKTTQPEIYHAVREKLKLWKLSDQEIDRIEHTQKIIHNFPLYADVSGIIKKRIAIIGAHVNTGEPLYSLIDLSKVWVILDVYERDIHNFSIGQTVQVKTSTYPDESFKGKISFIPPTLNNQTRTVPIRVELHNKGMKLKPGMLAFAKIELSQNKIIKKGVIIPKSAVLWTGKRSVVYVKPEPEESIFEMREVTLGQAMKNTYLITDGLKENEEVVTQGAFTIDASAQLVGKNSLMNSSNKEIEEEISFEAGNLFRKQLTNFYNAYLKIKNFMVHDKKTEAIKKEEWAIVLLEKVEISTLNEKDKKKWLELKSKLKQSLNAMTKAKNSKEEKTNFKVLSENLAKAIVEFGVNKESYTFYCPMAKAIWISDEKKVLNPYFGSEMLTCGVLKNKIIHKFNKNLY